MTRELWLYGVLFPPLLLAGAAAAGATALLRRVWGWAGLYRFVWHPALFDLAVFVVLLAGFNGMISG